MAYAPELAVASRLEARPARLTIALDGITDPQNFGAVIRSAVALGDGSVLWAENRSAPLTPATFRASAGAVEHAELVRVRSLRQTLESLATAGVLTVGLEAGAQQTLGELDLTGPTMIVVGAEDEGLSRGVRRLLGARARLDMTGRLDSLNASVAAALALYEARRQRGSASQ
jgi:23S rRNA (guanosine2251-2'-O)-methyltransferase